MTTYIVCGPTASGKSALALSLAQHENGNIINADSMQIYQKFPTLSAQPSIEDQKLVPHLLYSALSVKDLNSVGKWLHLVAEIVGSTQGNPLIFVGGTGLYIQALLEGISPTPNIPLSLRKELESLLHATSKEHLFTLLQKEDPHAAEKIGPHNTQRILRALEVIRHTNKSLIEWQKTPKEKVIELPLPIKIILIDPAREALYASINQRVEQMLQTGAIEEVKKLQELDITPSATASKILGYEEIFSYLKGYLSYGEMTEQIQQKTRQYAKRQMTWFRHQISPDFIWPKIYSPADWPHFLSEMKW